MKYRFVAHRGTSIALLEHPRYHQQVWTLVWVRTHKRCVITGKDLYKQEAWSPITNGYNRMERISKEGMIQLKTTD